MQDVKDSSKPKLSIGGALVLLFVVMTFILSGITCCMQPDKKVPTREQIAFEALCSSINQTNAKIDELTKAVNELKTELKNEAIRKSKLRASGASRRVTLTTYQATKKQCGNSKGITFSGKRVRKGYVAVSHDLIRKGWKMGKKVYIPSMNKEPYEIADRTAARCHNLIDIYEPDPSKNVTKTNVLVYLLPS